MASNERMVPLLICCLLPLCRHRGGQGLTGDKQTTLFDRQDGKDSWRVTHLALLNTKESLTMTTGPAQDIPESWWLQSSHPENRHPGISGGIKRGGRCPQASHPAWGDPQHSPQVQKVSNTGHVPLGEKPSSTAHGTAAQVSSMGMQDRVSVNESNENLPT